MTCQERCGIIITVIMMTMSIESKLRKEWEERALKNPKIKRDDVDTFTFEQWTVREKFYPPVRGWSLELQVHTS